MPNTNGGRLLLRFCSSYRKSLEKVAFRILSNINDRTAKVCTALLEYWANVALVW